MQVNKPASKDKEVNDFGMYLLNICEQFGFQIINGTTMSADILRMYPQLVAV